MPLWALIVMVLIGALFAVKLLYVFSTGGMLPVTRGALFVTTSPTRVQALLDALPMGSENRLYDLGCGDGRVLRAAAARYGVQGVGFEINPIAYLAAKVRCIGEKNIHIRYGNFWRANLHGADIVFCYLFPDLMAHLGEKLAAELKNGARVVSCNFPLTGWRPLQVLHPRPRRHGDPIYLYRHPDSGPKSATFD